MHDVSPLSGPVTEDDVTVEVRIYRALGEAAGWVLEVIDEGGGSTVWADPFPTDREALLAFRAAVEEYGLDSFAEAPSATLH